MENSGPANNQTKYTSDRVKAMKALRDMYSVIDKSLPGRDKSRPIDAARDKIILPGIIFTSWSYELFALFPVNGEWCVIDHIDTTPLPTTLDDFYMVLSCCELFLKAKVYININIHYTVDVILRIFFFSLPNCFFFFIFIKAILQKSVECYSKCKSIKQTLRISEIVRPSEHRTPVKKSKSTK